MDKRYFKLLFPLLFCFFIFCSTEETQINKPAKIELITPIDSTDIILGSIIYIETTITDEDGEVTSANLKIDGIQIETLGSSPFKFTWNTELENEGEHMVTITATDDDNTISTFETKTVLTSDFICGRDFFDPRDGNIYKTVLIGEQCWMAENLNFSTAEGSTNYAGHKDNGELYGKLYNYEAALEAVPEGWHLPSDEEWKILEGTVDSEIKIGDVVWDDWSYRGTDAGKNLKSQSGWVENGNGTDLFGFNALPGGYSYGEDRYQNIGFSANFWTKTNAGVNVWWTRELYSVKNSIHRSFEGEEWALSVRCIKD